MNEYDKFIAFLHQKCDLGELKNVFVQKHHILPIHAGGLKNGETVLCSLKDHALAHLIRYRAFGDVKDKMAFLFMRNQTEQGVRLRQQLIIDTNRIRKNTFFNQAWQKQQANKPKSTYYLKKNPEMAKKFGRLGGSKGGKIMTEKKALNLKILGKNVGKAFGRKNGIQSRQFAETRSMLEKSLIWEHKTGVYVETSCLETISDLKIILNKHVPNSVSHSSGLSAILRRKEPMRYGWKIQNMAISSQAKNGL